ncbi:9860_t:CDS:2, partial [Racocetra persica]
EAAWNSKVLLEDVKTITLHRGELTTGRRNDPIDQLRCVGGDACHRYTPDVIQCTNTGFDGSDANWRCNADLPENLKFGPFIISDNINAGQNGLSIWMNMLNGFEVFHGLMAYTVTKYFDILIYIGYSYPDDPYILQGSCGLEYTLYYKNDWKKDRNYQWFEDNDYFRYDDSPNNNHHQNFWPGGGGGRFYPRNDPYDYDSSQPGNMGQNFWTGLGVGAAAGYFLGRNSRSRRPRSEATTYTSSSSSGSRTISSQGFGRTKRR